MHVLQCVVFVIVKCIEFTITHILCSVNTLIECTRRERKKEGEFDCPLGLTLYELMYKLIHIHCTFMWSIHKSQCYVRKSEKCLKFSSTYDA